MLRTKQLGTLSQCARSFYLNGPRCGGSDGASCTCPDDQKCVSKRLSNNPGFGSKPITSHASPSVATKAGLPYFQNTVRYISPHNHESSSRAASSPHDLNTIHGRANCVNNDIHSSQKVLMPPKITPDHFVKTGIPSVGVLSEFMKYKTTDGPECLVQKSCIVDSTQPSPDIRSCGKSHDGYKHSKVQPSSSSNTQGSNSNFTTDSNPSNKAVKTGSVKATGASNWIPSNEQNKKQSRSRRTTSHSHTVLAERPKCRSDNVVPQKAKFHSDNFVSQRTSSARVASNTNTSDAKSKGISERKEATGEAEKYRDCNKLQHPMRSMRLQGGTHRSTSVRVVELYFHTLQKLQWGPSAEAALDNLHYNLDVFQANQVLKLLRDHSVAFGFFKWLKHQFGFKHDEHTYTTMIGILGQARQFGAIRRLLEEMIGDGCQPTVVTYNRLIHAYGRANYIDEAVKVFHQMQEAGYVPDRVTYCTLIDIHAKAGYLEVALDLYQRMQDVGLSPDTFTYSAMVNCLGKGGHLAAAYKLFCEMIEQGCVPNLVTYNIMIALQAKARNYPCAVKLYRDMQSAGFRPDKITYSIVMEVLGHCGHLDEVEDVFTEMQQDWVPDEPAYGLLVDIWGKAGNLDKARTWYQSMLDAGLRPNVPTCNSLLSAFLKVHRFSDAYDVLRNMLQLRLVPSLQTYTLLLSCCTESLSQMGLCSKLMAITGHPAHMFLVSLPDAEPGGQNVRDHASNFFDLMHSEDRESKRGLVDAVVDFLHKTGLKEEAGLVWEVAAERNVYPDSVREKNSSYWLINLHVMSEGTAVTALSRTLAWFRRRILYSGSAPHRIDIVTGWGRRSRITGTSLVRQSVQDLLHVFRFPFATEHGNSGCFVGCGEPLNQWLLNSYVERMHLL